MHLQYFGAVSAKLDTWRRNRALNAQSWFASHAPPDAPPLPLSYGDREDMKRGGLSHIVAWFAQSLEARDYDFDTHPSFEEYARGVMASAHAPDFIKEDQQLQMRFGRRLLPGIGPGLYWDPPQNNGHHPSLL
jgi:hypothetical protein